MKTLFAALMIVAVAGSAVAGINTGKPMGPLDLVIDPDGTASIVNAGAAAFSFDGYTIEVNTGFVYALPDLTGIFDNTVADMTGFPPIVGLTMSEALAWTEMSKTPTNYSEVTMDKVATLQSNGKFVLGNLLGLDQQIGTFTYVDSTQPVGQTSFEGDIIVIPEPATMGLLGLGAVALIRRRR